MIKGTINKFKSLLKQQTTKQTKTKQEIYEQYYNIYNESYILLLIIQNNNSLLIENETINKEYNCKTIIKERDLKNLLNNLIKIFSNNLDKLISISHEIEKNIPKNNNFKFESQLPKTFIYFNKLEQHLKTIIIELTEIYKQINKDQIQTSKEKYYKIESQQNKELFENTLNQIIELKQNLNIILKFIAHNSQ